MKLIAKGFTTLEKLPNGSLFLHDDTLCLKTEYCTDNGCIEAYIVGSGEFFGGGAPDDLLGELKVLMVEPILELSDEDH